MVTMTKCDWADASKVKSNLFSYVNAYAHQFKRDSPEEEFAKKVDNAFYNLFGKYNRTVYDIGTTHEIFDYFTNMWQGKLTFRQASISTLDWQRHWIKQYSKPEEVKAIWLMRNWLQIYAGGINMCNPSFFGSGAGISNGVTITKRYHVQVEFSSYITGIGFSASTFLAKAINKIQPLGWGIENINQSGNTLEFDLIEHGSVTIGAIIAIVFGVLLAFGLVTVAWYKIKSGEQAAQIVDSTQAFESGLNQQVSEGNITSDQAQGIRDQFYGIASQSGAQVGFQGITQTLTEMLPLVIIGGLGIAAMGMFKKS